MMYANRKRRNETYIETKTKTYIEFKNKIRLKQVRIMCFSLVLHIEKQFPSQKLKISKTAHTYDTHCIYFHLENNLICDSPVCKINL